MFSKIKGVPCSFNNNLTISITSNNSLELLVAVDPNLTKATLRCAFRAKEAYKIINSLLHQPEDRTLEIQCSDKAAVASKHQEWLDQRKKEIR